MSPIHNPADVLPGQAATPEQADAHNQRGLAFEEMNRYAEALESYEQALCCMPNFADAYNNRANALDKLGRAEEALLSYEKAIQLEPDHVCAHYNRGVVQVELKRPAEAVLSYDAALLLKPDFGEAHNNRGIALAELKLHAEALASYEHALRLKPDFADAHNNRAVALGELKRQPEALNSYAQALHFQPDFADAHKNEALCRLLMGDLKPGWQKYEWRWKTRRGVTLARNLTPQLWLGQEPLQGKTILLYAEQGYGDTIQFCRYVAQVAALGATVVLEVPAPLKSLMRDLDGVAVLLSTGEPLPSVDFQCPLMSLPLAFQTELDSISSASYLHSNSVKRAFWESRLIQHHKQRVALVWSGNSDYKNDTDRSIPLSLLRSKLQTVAQEGIDFYCLQQELRPADQATLALAPEIHFFGKELLDFSDTAALLDCMDLVITVDTSVAHLAGAMGKQVWILLPFIPDWRWLLERTDSPWYGSARLFRQPAIGDWSSVLAEVASALSAHVRLGMPRQTAAAEISTEVTTKRITQDFIALHLQATLAIQSNDFASAVGLFDRAIAIDPKQADAHNNRGIALACMQQTAAALQSFEMALQLQPEYAGAHNNRGLALYDLQRFPEALQSYEKALAIEPEHAEAPFNRGNVLSVMQRFTAALHSYDLALRLQPEHVGAHYNRGLALSQLQRPLEALASYEQALRFKPDYADAQWNLGLCHLLLGNFDAGWQMYEWRWKTTHFSHAARIFSQSLWVGQADLQGKTILLYAEQGMGDTIQFCRYVAQVAALGATVVLEVPASLKLLLHDLNGVTVLLSTGETLPDFDYQCPLMSLPLAFESRLNTISTISNLSYVRCDAQKRTGWQIKLPQNNRKRIGLVWRGNAENSNNLERCIGLDAILALMSTMAEEGIDFYCLQKELSATELAAFEKTQAIRFFGNELMDFSDTAALIDLMDLVITVDTSVAHLAGAMGKEVWILLPVIPDWRWLLDRTDSPWYPSARLFRQNAKGGWDSVLAQVAVALHQRFDQPPDTLLELRVS